MIDPQKYPHLAKMQSVSNESQAIGEFIDWLQSQGMAICSTDASQNGRLYYPVMTTTEELLARHFAVDLKGAESERRQILAEVPKH